MEKREIKFRAWNGNKMVTQFDGVADIDTFNTCDKKGLLVCIGGYEWDRANWGKDCILMQYIGMRDVNNKEIYEGDILQWTSKFKDTDITTPNKRGQVKYNQQGCVWHIDYEMQGKHYYKDLMATFGGEVYVMETVEIVGNIFETPELLNF